MESQNIVALCDVDAWRRHTQRKKETNVKRDANNRRLGAFSMGEVVDSLPTGRWV